VTFSNTSLQFSYDGGVVEIVEQLDGVAHPFAPGGGSVMLGRADVRPHPTETIMGRFLTGLGAAVLVAGAAWFFTGAAPTDAQQKGKGAAVPRVAWEYKSVTIFSRQPDDGELNKLGAEGWELVTGYHATGLSVHTFKRHM